MVVFIYTALILPADLGRTAAEMVFRSWEAARRAIPAGYLIQPSARLFVGNFLGWTWLGFPFTRSFHG
jgi:hypothetical protein